MSSINSIALGFLIGGGLVIYTLMKDTKETIIEAPANILKKIKDVAFTKPEDKGALDK
jgi:hypothetical protein